MPKAWHCALPFLLLTSLQPAFAGMQQDLADCADTNRPTSSAACTRILKSGRLPRNEFYIGHYNRGWAHYYDGEHDKALADFDQAIRYHPTYAESYYSRAVVQHDRGETHKSLLDLDRYQEIKGDGEVARYNRAILFHRQGDNERALAELMAVPGDARSKHNVRILRGLVHYDLGNLAAARQEIDAVLASAPANASALYARALMSFRDMQLDAATADAQKALALQRDFSEAHIVLGRIAERRADRAAASVHYRQVGSLPAKSVSAHLARKEARQRLQMLSGSPIATVADTRTRSGACRRFIPAASITITVDCTDH